MELFAAQQVGAQEVEFLLRAALFQHGSALLSGLFQQAADRADAQYQPRPGEHRKGRVRIQVQGVLGNWELRRDYYYHAGKHQGHYPADAALGLEQGHTPALMRLVCLEGADEASYQKAENHLAETGGIPMEARQIQRLLHRVGEAAQQWQQRDYRPEQTEACDAAVMYVSGDGTGVPMRAEQLRGRQGHQADGSAKTRQAYLGCVFTQHQVDEKGSPVRDHESTTYVSSLGPIDQFGPMIRQEALRRGMGQVPRVVLLIDGASGLEKMGRLNFKDALQIVDFYHAVEHGGRVLEALLGSKEHPDFKLRQRRWAKRLLANGVNQLMADVRRESAGRACAAAVEKQLHYFVNNPERMQYRTFRRAGYFIGSGVIEAGCKTVIGARCKQSGMFWGEPGAEHILAFRCIHASRRLDAFWKHRLNQLASRNDALPLAA